MNRWKAIRAFCHLAAITMLVLPVAAKAGEVELNGRTFTLPDGFEIELIAGPPLVDRPITIDFDEQGRLYVADSSGSNDPVQKQLVDRTHRILRLEDTDGDGKFDSQTVFADRMMFPEGTMWLDGSLYVAAPPSIWKLTDTDNDGVADQREEWFQGKTLTGCANDLHGPYPGPDGWIYWCKGAFAEQTYERPGKKPFVTKASHIFRCRPDGSGIEPVMTGGMDNPVDVSFMPGGDRILTSTFLIQPGGGLRDGLIHAIYGGVYGKVHSVIDGHPRTSPDVMPVLSHLGAAAPCGLARYESTAFGNDFKDNLFATCFNLHKVTRHVLTRAGALYQSSDEDFLTSATDQDFHPTDVQMDADGSLIVVDTGGWYKLCCPTSQLGKPDVLGGIYRIRRAGAAKVNDPRGLKLPWATMNVAELAKRLDDPRPAVRQRAVKELARQGTTALPELRETIRGKGWDEGRRNAVWTASRIDHPHARELVRRALDDQNEHVRLAALHAVGLWRDRDALPMLAELLDSRTAAFRRAAAEALGRIGDKTAVPWLLHASARPIDRAEEHSIIYALIEINAPDETSTGLASANLQTARAALIALDQMETASLKPETVAPGLTSDDLEMREAASWIVGRHPEWGDALAGSLRQRLTSPNLTSAARLELERQLARFAGNASIQTLLTDRLSDGQASRAERLSVLKAMAQSGLKQAPDDWSDALIGLLNDPDEDLRRQAVTSARALPASKGKAAEVGKALLLVAQDEDAPASERLDALLAMPGGPGKLTEGLFTFLRDQLDPDQPAAERTAAADVLAKSKLSNDQLSGLADVLKGAGPLEATRLLGAFEQSTNEAVGLKFIDALKQSPALLGLRVELIKPRLAKYPETVRDQAEPLYATINADAEKQKARLDALLGSLSSGDVRRGQAVFNSTKASCVTCHAIGYLGGKVGPDLTHIGKVRNERDLLEAIVFPSASFVRSFEPVTIATTDGQVVNGLVKVDAPDEVVLTTGVNEEARIARADIEEMRPGTVSVMPAGLDQQLTPQELADLVAFLKACK